MPTITYNKDSSNETLTIPFTVSSNPIIISGNFVCNQNIIIFICNGKRYEIKTNENGKAQMK